MAKTHKNPLGQFLSDLWSGESAIEIKSESPLTTEELRKRKDAKDAKTKAAIKKIAEEGWTPPTDDGGGDGEKEEKKKGTTFNAWPFNAIRKGARELIGGPDPLVTSSEDVEKVPPKDDKDPKVTAALNKISKSWS